MMYVTPAGNADDTLPGKYKPATLPTTKEEMLNRKTMRSVLTLNDYVDQIHEYLYLDDEKYTEFLDAVYDEDAVEGSLAADNLMAAEIIRDYAKKNKDKFRYVADKKLATIVKALNIVLRRYHVTRKERAVSLGGKPVNGE